MSQKQEIKCFVIDGVTFIGIIEEGRQPQAVAAVSSQKGPEGTQLIISALSPFMDPAVSPVFPQAAIDRALVTFAPSESVLVTYGKYQESLLEILEIPETEVPPTLAADECELGKDGQPIN